MSIEDHIHADTDECACIGTAPTEAPKLDVEAIRERVEKADKLARAVYSVWQTNDPACMKLFGSNLTAMWAYDVMNWIATDIPALLDALASERERADKAEKRILYTERKVRVALEQALSHVVSGWPRSAETEEMIRSALDSADPSAEPKR